MRYPSFDWRTLILATIIGIATGSIFQIRPIATAHSESLPQQDVLRLENRLTQLEQRLYTIENSVRSVEQQSRMASVSSRAVSQDELNLMRSQLQSLERRLADDECGMARLDERTLSPQRRQARKVSASDQCRQNTDAPLRLP